MKHLLVESFANCTCVNIWRSIARPSLRRKCNVRWRRVRQSGRAMHTCRKDGQIVIHKMRCRSSLLSRWKFGHWLIDAGKIGFSRVFRLWISVEMRLQKFRFSSSMKFCCCHLFGRWEKFGFEPPIKFRFCISSSSMKCCLSYFIIISSKLFG